ncbi:MAG: lipid A deacylase LpxR family protein [Pseudohaliea sp.]
MSASAPPAARWPLLVAGLFIAAAGGGVRAADDEGAWGLVIENDVFSDTDRHYTNGIRLGHILPHNVTPDWLRKASDRTGLFPEHAAYRTVLSIGQNMYTPRDITIDPPDPADRPYAGWLYATAGISGRKGQQLNSLELSMGVIGPASLAGPTQDRFHQLIGSEDPRGWEHQLQNEPALMATYQRRWNLRPRPLGPFEVTLSPHGGFALGNVFTYANFGASLLFGDDIADQFGPPRIQPSVPGAGLVEASDRGWYLYASVEARAVAQNIFLDGNTFRDSASVDRLPLVGDLQVGAVLSVRGFQLAYTHVFRSDEFEGQRDNASFGAFSVLLAF